MLDSVWTAKGELMSTNIRVRLKETGLFDLVVYVQTDKKSSTFPRAGVWLLDATKATPRPLFPEIDGTYGLCDLFSQMGLTGDGQLATSLRATTNGTCCLTLKRGRPFETIFKAVGEGVVIKEEWSTNTKHTVICRVQLPRQGLYALNMYASEPGVSLKHKIGNLLLEWD